MKTILCNAFSLSMLPAEAFLSVLSVDRVPLATARLQLSRGFTSAVGHATTASLLAGLLSLPVEVNRVNVALDEDTQLVVAQFTGTRLPEGATTLPEGAELTWFLVRMVNKYV